MLDHLHKIVPTMFFSTSPWPYNLVEEIILDEAFCTCVKALDLDLTVKSWDLMCSSLRDYMSTMVPMKFTCCERWNNVSSHGYQFFPSEPFRESVLELYRQANYNLKHKNIEWDHFHCVRALDLDLGVKSWDLVHPTLVTIWYEIPNKTHLLQFIAYCSQSRFAFSTLGPFMKVSLNYLSKQSTTQERWVNSTSYLC